MSINIHAEDFRSYPVLDWSIPEGLTLIDGQNMDTGGSNMAGKSTMLDTWFWCRYGWLPKWGGPKGGQSDSVIRRKNGQSQGGCLVKVTEQIGADTLEIQRERPSKLTVWKNGAEIKGIDQKGLEKLLGMSADRFLVCVYLSQKRRNSFYWMSDSERMDLLSIIAGLEQLDKALNETKEEKRTAELLYSQAESAIHIFKTQLIKMPEHLRNLKSHRFDINCRHGDARESAFKAKLALDVAKNRRDVECQKRCQAVELTYSDQIVQIKWDKTGLKTAMDQYKNQLASMPSLDPELLLGVEKIKVKILEAKNFNDLVDSIEDSNKNIRWSMTREIDAAKNSQNGQCDACNQILPEADRTSEMLRHIQSAKELEKRLKEVPVKKDINQLQIELQAILEEVTKKKTELEVLPSQLRSKISEIEAKYQQKNIEQRQLEGAILSEQRAIEQEYATELSTLERNLYTANKEVEHLDEMYSQADEAYKNAKAQEATLQDSLNDAQKAFDSAKERLDMALDLIELFGPKGYRAVCFEGLVERISQRASELLAVMTDGLYTTRLEQISQDSKGNQKLILKPIIIKGSAEVPQDDLSGGAETRVALAYDVAVSESAGDGLPLLLDEALEGLDAVGKSEAMILLEEVSKSRPVLVIDHASEFKASFNQALTITYRNEESVLGDSP